MGDAADVGVDEAMPVTDAYREGNNRFTGKIGKVTIDLKEMKAADKAEADKAHREAAHKKALSD